MELKHEQLVYEKQASCFFRRVVQDDRKRVLDCVILSLKYGEYRWTIKSRKVDIRYEKWTFRTKKWTLKYKFKKKRSKIYEGTGKANQLCDSADTEQ